MDKKHLPDDLQRCASDQNCEGCAFAGVEDGSCMDAIMLSAADEIAALRAEVVRCGECRHSSRIANDVAMMRHCWNGRGRNNGDGFSRVKQDSYCDEGERRKEQNNG